MREIKFRVWDGECNEFDYPNEFRIQKGQIGWTADHYLDIDNHCQHDRYVIEQYIGLKDKNGQDIYEGDLVNFDWFSGTSNEPIKEKYLAQEVYFKDSMFLFGRGLMGATNDYGFIEESLEIVGNTHETPELLKR